MAGLIDSIKDLFSGKTDPELIRLEGGKSACSTCSEPLKGRQIFKVPGSDKHYCREHARDEMDKYREESMSAVPDDLKPKVHFSKEDGFYLACIQCSRKMSAKDKKWLECDYCKEALCQDHAPYHNCAQKQQAAKEKRESETPRRCTFCGKKIVSDTSVKCDKCKDYFCLAHAKPDHHNCKA